MVNTTKTPKPISKKEKSTMMSTSADNCAFVLFLNAPLVENKTAPLPSQQGLQWYNQV
jgi:hypothetical protein